MSNSLTQNPVIISTAMAQSYKAAILAASGSFNVLLVKNILWQGAGAAGDKITITDGGAVTLLNLVAQGANIPQEVTFFPPVIWRDFQVTLINSGTLSIQLA